MRRGWIAVLLLAVLLVGAYAVTSSPLFNRPKDVGEGSELDYTLDYSDGVFVFTVTNDTEEARKLEFMTGEHFRLLVKEGDEEVFNSSEGKMFTQQINHIELEAGEQKTFTAEWTPAEKGIYRVEAYLLAVSRDEPVKTTEITID